MLYRIGYNICWSLGLLFATFPHIFDGKMDFDLRNKTFGKVCDDFIFPFVMAMILFLIDVAYGYTKEMIDRQYTNVISIIICLVLFLLGFVFTIYIHDPFWARICFIITWACLSLMKFLKTDLYSTKKYPTAGRIPTN